MPYIELKTTAKISDAKKDELTKSFGELIEIIPGKTEEWLMLGFMPECKMAFKGNSDSDTAILEVKILGKTTSAVYEKLTAALTECVSRALNVPSERIYVKYEECSVWGYDGYNF